jgi:hypothetical protein
MWRRPDCLGHGAITFTFASDCTPADRLRGSTHVLAVRRAIALRKNTPVASPSSSACRRLVLIAFACAFCVGGAEACSGGTVANVVSDGGTGDGGAEAGLLAPDTSCRASYPVSQPLSAPCCPDRGADACGAGLFCAAFDGRTQPTCYPEHSRFDAQSCTADVQCLTTSACDSSGVCKGKADGGCTTPGCNQPPPTDGGTTTPGKCPSTCATNAACQATCPTSGTLVACCDTITSICYATNAGKCP